MLDVASIAVPRINIINRIVAGILDDVRRLNGMYHMLYKIHQQQRTDDRHDNPKGHRQLRYAKGHIILMNRLEYQQAIAKGANKRS